VVRPTAEALDANARDIEIDPWAWEYPPPSCRKSVRDRDPNLSRGDRTPDSDVRGLRRAGQAFAMLTLEAMKMETVQHAERHGVVAETLVKVGTQVDSKDLLFEIQAQC